MKPGNSIEVRRLTRYFGSVPAVKDLSFSVREGEVIGFLGPNGAGKSTTMRIISGLISATSGEVYVNDISVARSPQKVRRVIGYMPENNPLPEDISVAEYLQFRAALKEVPGRERKRRVAEVMEICGLQRKESRRQIGKLSKGFRQRVGIADAIIARPLVTIMDEPTIGLDPHQVLAIRELIRNLRGETTLILSSHILSEVERSCDQVLIINHGHKVAQGSPEELRRQFLGDQQFVVEIAGSRDVIKQRIRELDTRAELHGPKREVEPSQFRRMEIRLTNENVRSEGLLEFLVNHPGIRVRSFYRKDARLEDIFLAATKRVWEIETHHLRPEPGRPRNRSRTEESPEPEEPGDEAKAWENSSQEEGP